MRFASRCLALLAALASVALLPRAAAAEDTASAAPAEAVPYRVARPSDLEVTVSGPVSAGGAFGGKGGVGLDFTYRRWLNHWLGVQGGLGYAWGNCDSEFAQSNLDFSVGCSFVVARAALAVAWGDGPISLFAAAGVEGGLATTHPVGPYGSDAPLLLPTLELGLHIQLADGIVVRPALLLATGAPLGLSLGYAF